MSATCRQCGAETEVVDSRKRLFNSIQTQRRRRRCKDCGLKHTTVEIDEYVLKAVLTGRRKI